MSVLIIRSIKLVLKVVQSALAVACQMSTIVQQELIVEDFQCSWTRFKFVVAAKDWNANKQLAIIPTLLRGRLIDYYVEMDGTTNDDLKLLKAALVLQEQTDMEEDPLLASRNFKQRNQGR